MYFLVVRFCVTHRHSLQGLKVVKIKEILEIAERALHWAGVCRLVREQLLDVDEPIDWQAEGQCSVVLLFFLRFLCRSLLASLVGAIA